METIESTSTNQNTILDVLRAAGYGGPIAVLMGGTGSEREVSLQSGAAAVASLRSMGVDVVSIDAVGDDVAAALQKVNPGFAFIALHGKGGEDGVIQALLRDLSIPYSGSKVQASALCMDKVRSKNVWRGLSLPTPDFVRLNSDTNFTEILDQLGGTVFVKPSEDGSSMGMSIASSEDELQHAYHMAAEYCGEVFAEKYILGPEYTVAILQGFELPSIRIETKRGFYDYAAKYEDKDTQFYIPSGLSVKKEQQLQMLALQAFAALGCEQWGRVDFMLDEKSDQFYLLEINTIPGLTSHSLVPMAAKAAGLNFDALMTNIIRLAVTSSDECSSDE